MVVFVQVQNQPNPTPLPVATSTPGRYTGPMANQTLPQAILEAVAWADGFDLALTPLEIRQQLPIQASLAEVLQTLAISSQLSATLYQRDGLVMLAGREWLVAERRKRAAAAWPKFRRVRRLARVLAHLPFVRTVAVCNTLALGHAKPSADLDLLVVSQAGRLWSCRLLCVTVAKLMGGRPSPRRHADRYCLSFYLAEDGLDVSRFQDPPGKDTYLAAWTSWVLPLYDAGGYTEAFAAANGWVKHRLPQTGWGPATPRWRAGGRRTSAFIVEAAWNDVLESLVEKLQRAYLPKALREAAADSGTGVVLNRTALKLHLDDRRNEINRRFMQQVTR